jgi:hypothetical protein
VKGMMDVDLAVQLVVLVRGCMDLTRDQVRCR